VKLDVTKCKGCPLEPLLNKRGWGIVHPEGGCSNGVALQGESPEHDEVRAEHPFAGRAGGVLTRGIRSVGEPRKNFGIFNTCQCRVPGGLKRGDHQEAIDHCKVHRDQILSAWEPSVIVPMGNFALESLGLERGITGKRGYPFWSDEYDVRIIPTFHPAFIMYGDKARKINPMALMLTLINDLSKALRNAPVDERQPTKNEIDPPRKVFDEFILHAYDSDWLMIDIETPHQPKSLPPAQDLTDKDPSTVILRCVLAYPVSDGKNTVIQCVTFPWQQPYLSLLRPLFENDIPKAFWNHDYDMDRIEFNGYKL